MNDSDDLAGARGGTAASRAVRLYRSLIARIKGEGGCVPQHTSCPGCDIAMELVISGRLIEAPCLLCGARFMKAPAKYPPIIWADAAAQRESETTK